MMKFRVSKIHFSSLVMKYIFKITEESFEIVKEVVIICTVGD